MKMKKTAIIVGFVAALGLATMQQAAARGMGGGYGGGHGGGYGGGPCLGYGMNAPQLDTATQEKIDAFLSDSVELRRQIAMKRAEKRALMANQPTDPAAIAQVTGELFDLRTQMHSKAQEAGVPMMSGPRGFGQGMHGGGMGRPGKNMRPCFYNQ